MGYRTKAMYRTDQTLVHQISNEITVFALSETGEATVCVSDGFALEYHYDHVSS